MSINNGTMSFNPIANPGITFEAKNHVGYTITYTLHAANQSLAGNTHNGSAFISTTALGNFVHDECDSGFAPNLDKTFTLTMPYVGYGPINSPFATESVFWTRGWSQTLGLRTT
jgi:hypothetical protein